MNKPPRHVRESQLRGLMQTNRDELIALYMKAAGIDFGQMPPIGILASQMIEAILAHEYPNEP
jgi:hypothetical protein